MVLLLNPFFLNICPPGPESMIVVMENMSRSKPPRKEKPKMPSLSKVSSNYQVWRQLNNFPICYPFLIHLFNLDNNKMPDFGAPYAKYFTLR